MKIRKAMCAVLLFTVLLTACAPKGESGGQTPADDLQGTDVSNQTAMAMEPIVQSYYAAQEMPAFSYFQNRSIGRFLAMWVEEATGIAEPVWDLDTFAAVQILDHDMAPATREGSDLYTCVFSDGADRYGYVIFAYEEAGPAVGNYGVHETTPYLYDLRANLEAVTAALQETDIDFATADAARVSWLDTKHNRSDQVILFTDGKGDAYLCYLGDAAIEAQKLP